MRKKRHIKALCAVLAVTLALTGTLTGCRGKQKETEDGGAKLTYWLGNNLGEYIKNFGTAESLQKIQEATGVEVEYIHPSSAAWEEQFNIMIASGEYTDIMQTNWDSGGYIGGTDKAIQDGVIIPLDEHMDKLPNYKKAMEAYPDVEKQIRTSEGKHAIFPVWSDSTLPNAHYGMLIRQDWLDKLNLEMPKTIDDWHAVLTAFKTKDPNGNGQADEIPLASYKAASFSAFAAAYGTLYGDFILKDGKMVYGSVQPEFKEFLAEMNKWYKEGLIDSEFAALEKSTMDANMTNDISGASVGYVGGQLGAYLAARQNDPSYKLVAAPWPSKTAGSTQYVGWQITRLYSNGGAAAISTQCKNVDAALRYLDYFYSPEGTDLLNWGIEGKTYTKENGKYQFTDFVIHNPDGKSPVEAITPITFTAFGVVPRITLGEAYAGVQYNEPAQKDASRIWGEGDTSLLTQVYPMTSEDKSEYSSILGEIKAYEAEMFTKFVMGRESLDNFDSYVERMKSYGVTKAEALQQAAYDRYMKE